jgi:YD repeat-containing protein
MKEPMTNNEMPMTARLRMQWACALFYFGLAAPGVAQSLNSQDNSGIQPFQTYSQDKESVNLATGSLNLSIPLLHLPGRAGHDVDVALSYNNQSVLYPTLGSHPVINTAPGGGGQPIPGLTQYVMGWTASSNYGWTTNFPSVTFQTLSSGAPAHYPQFTGSCFGAPSLSDVRGQQMTFGVALFGCSAGLTPTNTTNVSPYLTTAADDQGSGVIADMSAPAGPTFFYPDGNRLVIPAAPAGQNLQELNPTTIFDVDRNGNTNTYTSTATNQVITDTLGRLVTFTWPSGGSPSDGVTNAIGASSIAYNNSNGQNQTIQLIYGGSPQAASGELDQPGISLQSSAGYGIVPQTASPGVIYIQWEGYGGNINNPNVNLSQNPLSAILLPNGQSYTFQYDAFGDLIKITYPDGGYTRYDYQKLQHGSAMVINNLQQVFQQDIMQVVAKHVCTSAATQIGATTAPVGNNCPIAEETTTYTPSSAITTNNWNTGNTSNTVVTADGTSVAHTFMAVTPSAPVYQFGAYESMYQAAPELAETTTAAGGTFLKSVSNTYEPDNAHLQTKVTTLDNGNTITEQWTYQQTAVTGAAFTQYPAPTGTPQIPGNEVPCTGYCNYTIPPSTGAFAGVDMVWNVVNYSVTDWNNNVLKTVADTWQTPVFSPNLPFLTSQKLSETIYQGSSTTPLSISQYLYDSYSAYPLTSSGAIQHGIPGMGFGSSFQSRGNMTAIKKWRNWDGSWITSQMQYDDAGNKIKDIDPNGNITSYSYADAWLNGSCASAGGGAVAYPTTVTNAMGQSTTELYNSCTGTAGIKTDANGQSTSYSYDTSDRVVDVLYPETYPGTATHAETKTCYSDSKSCQGATASSNYVLVSSNITPSLWAISETDLDGIGRKTAQKTLSDPYGAMEVDTSYDMMERLQSVSNPYRPSAGGTTGSTTYTYDGLSRQLTETTPDNHQLLSTYSGTTTHSWDETQREWTHVTDALNRLTEVLEPDSSGSDTVATQYQYDSLGNLTRVDQWGGPIGSAGDRVRTFTYDSLSQLLTSYNPEAGTTCYGTGNSSSCTPGYDLDGNLLVQTDARGISTNFSVDSLNRVTSRSYSDGTASACFIYDNASSDPSGAHRVGRLLFEWTQHGTCPGNASGVPSNAINYRVVNSYDPKGQVTNETQCPSSPCSTAYTFPYTYDLAGNVTSWAAGLSNTPTLTSTFDAANRLSNVTSSMSDNAHPGILFRADSTTATTVGVPYGPFGMLNAESAVSNSTNQAAITTTHSYDTRGRILSEINNDAAGSSTPSSGQININFAEQQKTITTSGGASTGSFTITGSDLPVTPCPSNAGYAPNCLDLGVVVLVIINPVNSSAISYNAEYVAGTSGSTLAQMLAGQINGNSSSLVTASANNSVVSLTSKATSGANNYGLYSVVQSITTQNTSSTVVGGPSYVVSASGPNDDIRGEAAQQRRSMTRVP